MYCNRLGISTIHNALEEKWFSTTPFFERWYNVMGAKEAVGCQNLLFHYIFKLWFKEEEVVVWQEAHLEFILHL